MITLRDFQIKGINKIKENEEKYQTGSVLAFDMGLGKCHKIDTPILMYDGTIKMVQDIKIGEYLMGDDSTPRKIMSLAQGKDEMYDIIPIKGDKYTVNQEHILCLKMSGYPEIRHNKTSKTHNYNIQWIENNKFKSRCFSYNLNEDNKYETEIEARKLLNSIKNQQIIEISVKNFLKLSKTRQLRLKTYRVPINFEEKKLPFDPYILGLWLGDGSSNGTCITNQDSSVIFYLKNVLPLYNCYLQYIKKYDYRINGTLEKNIDTPFYNKGSNIFLNTLKELNLIKNKHIPMIYKCNSKENRLKLLAGLIDSDGSLVDDGCTFDFIQKSEIIIDDVIYLCRSLGFSCYKSKQRKGCWYKGHYKKDDYFRIAISGNTNEIPTLIPRKKANPRKQVKNVLCNGITIKHVGKDNYYGFTIDNNNRYVMGDFTVTHNTLTMASFLLGQRKNENSEFSDLIIVPLCVLTQWKSEILRLDDKSDVFIYHGSDRFRDFKYLKKTPDFVISTYHSLVTRELEKNEWNRIVLDEAHIIRNGMETKYKNIPKRVSGAYSISKKAKYCHCITGTPFNNGLNDLKSLMKFVSYKGDDVKNFVDIFVIQKTKKDIIEPIVIDTILIKRPEKGLENYNRLVKNYMTILAKLNTKINIIELRELHKQAMMIMMKMRLYCDIMQINRLKEIVVEETDANEIYEEEEFTEEEKYEFYNTSIKIKTVYDKIEELLPIIPNKRIIVFSSFVTTLDLLKIIIKNKMPDTLVFEYIGKKTSDERSKIVEEFTNIKQTKSMVLLATIGAGSCGLILTPCSTVILADITINPFDQLQAINRVHRITQVNKVKVYKFCMQDMIEETILRTHDKKINEAKRNGIIMI